MDPESGKQPFRDGIQEVISIESASRLMVSQSRSEGTFPLITKSDSSQHVPAVDEFSYGRLVRIRLHVLRWDKYHVWTVNHPNRCDDASPGDSIVSRGPWMVYSHRRQRHVKFEDGSQLELPTVGKARETASPLKYQPHGATQVSSSEMIRWMATYTMSFSPPAHRTKQTTFCPNLSQPANRKMTNHSMRPLWGVFLVCGRTVG